MSGDLDLRGPLEAVRRQLRFILGVSLAAAVVMLGVAFLIPKWYTATAVILPPEESDLVSNISLAQRALTKFPTFGILSDYFTPADIFKAILGSRTVMEEVVQHFDLQTLYRIRSMEKTVKVLRGHTKVRLNPDGTIAVSVEDRSPVRAAAMTNAFLAALDRFNVEKRNTTAHRTRQFLQNRVAETDSLLRVSEASLRNYQERRHAVVPMSAGSADLQSAADLMSRKIQLEVRLGVLRGYLREDNDQVVQTRLELDQLRQKIASLPAIQGDLQRLVRDEKVYEQLYLVLTGELEQARIRETMDTPTVQLLDPALPPERQSWPRRGLLTAAAFVVAFVAASGWVIRRDRAASAVRA